MWENSNQESTINAPSEQENASNPVFYNPSQNTHIIESSSQPENPKSSNAERSYQEKPSASPVRFVQSNTLHFKIKAETLKKAVSPLVDSKFNPLGFGKIDMTTNGLDIMVCNTYSSVMGRLFLESQFLIDFEYNSYLHKTRIEKSANIACIQENLSGVFDNEIVTVFNPFMSDHLVFQPGNQPTSRFSVELSEPVKEEEMFSNYWFGSSSDGLVSDNNLKRMIKNLRQLLEKQQPPIVSAVVKILKHTGQITAGKNNLKTHEKLKADKNTPLNSAMFYWRHPEMLEKASALKATCYVRVYREPLKWIMMRFEYEGVGSLILLTNAAKD